jgi:hypothetical protein
MLNITFHSYYNDGLHNAILTYGDSFTTDDIIQCIALDMDTKVIFWYKWCLV